MHLDNSPRPATLSKPLLVWFRRVLPLVLLVGCSEPDQIRRYKAPKPAAVAVSALDSTADADQAGAAPAGAGMDQAGSPHAARPGGAQRMLAAIIPHQGQAWFFKVSGPPDKVAAHAQRFTQLLSSTRFADGKPVWQIPEGWSAQPGSGMRFATLLLDAAAGQPLELTVIPLPIPAGDQAEYVLSNVNRWRGQLGLPPISKQQLPEEAATIQLEGAEATWVDLTSVASAAAAAAGASSAAAAGPAADSGRPAGSKID